MLGVGGVHRGRELELLEREGQIPFGARQLAETLVERGALAALAPAGLLDQREQLLAGLGPTPALGQAVGQRQAQPLVARHEGDGPLQHRHGAHQHAEAGVDLRRLAGAGHDQRLVVRLLAAVGQHAGQRLPGLRLAIEPRQALAQGVGARLVGQRPLEAGDGAVTLAGREVRGRQRRRRRRRAPDPSVMASRRSSQPAAAVASPAVEREAPERVERLRRRLQLGDALPGRRRRGAHRRAPSRTGGPARPTARPRPTGCPSSARMRCLLLVDVGELAGLALRQQDLREARARSRRVPAARPGWRAGRRRRCSAARAGHRPARSRGAATAGARCPTSLPARPAAGRWRRRSGARPRRAAPGPRAPPSSAGASSCSVRQIRIAPAVSAEGRLASARRRGAASRGGSRRRPGAARPRAAAQIARRTRSAPPAATCRPHALVDGVRRGLDRGRAGRAPGPSVREARGPLGELRRGAPGPEARRTSPARRRPPRARPRGRSAARPRAAAASRPARRRRACAAAPRAAAASGRAPARRPAPGASAASAAAGSWQSERNVAATRACSSRRAAGSSSAPPVGGLRQRGRRRRAASPPRGPATRRAASARWRASPATPPASTISAAAAGSSPRRTVTASRRRRGPRRSGVSASAAS